MTTNGAGYSSALVLGPIKFAMDRRRYEYVAGTMFTTQNHALTVQCEWVF